MRKTIVLVIAICFILTPALASAQEVTEIISEDVENATMKAPSSWGVLWQGIKERVTLAFTFDQVKESELRLKYAEKRTEWAEKFAESDNEKLQAKAEKMMDKADALMIKVEERKEKWLERVDEKTSKIVERLADFQEKKQATLEKLELRLTEEDKESVRARLEEHKGKATKLLNAINNENLPEKIQEHLVAVKERIEMHAEEITEFNEKKKELLTEIKEGSETAKDELTELREERQDWVRERVGETVVKFNELIKKDVDNADEEEGEESTNNQIPIINEEEEENINNQLPIINNTKEEDESEGVLEVEDMNGNGVKVEVHGGQGKIELKLGQ